MPPRLLRFLQDPQAWFGLLSGLASLAFTLLSTNWDDTQGNLAGLAQQFQGLLAPLHLPPSLTLSAVAALFALLAAWALLAALARHSLLLKPERFIIKAEDPRHLVGREKETDGLAKACADNTLTVLKGESGAGKSALVKAGLKPKLDADPHSRLLPLLIDASGLDWDGGLRAALAQAWAALPKERRQLLGDNAPAAPADKLFERLAKLPELVPKKLLLILDQIDDYFVAQREHFLTEGVVVKPATLEQANKDWAALAGLLRRKRVHLLLVCRKDEDMLSALHCVEPAYFPLARIETNLISPLLEQITEDDGHGAVVADPEAGWLQLKARLLRDLAEGGQILPVRLVLALDSLRSFRFLTLAQYSKRGGARGLDRLYVEKHLQDAKHALGLDPAAVLRALALLAEEDGSKTRRAAQADFAAALSTGPNPAKDAAPLLDFLEQNRLLRRQSGQDGEFLLLYHDYLARGVRDAYKQANRWTELLRAKSKEFNEALTWRQRWVALLSLRDQLGLAVARLRGKFNYGVYRGLAGWSLLRLLPLLLSFGLVFIADWRVDEMRQEQEVANLLNRVGNKEMTKDELEAWRTLAGLSEYARIHAVHLAVSNRGLMSRLSGKSELLAHSVLGFDLSGSLSSKITREIIAPCVSPSIDVAGYDGVFCAQFGAELNLRLSSPMAKLFVSTLIERIGAEKDYERLLLLYKALDGLSRKLDIGDAKPVAAMFVEHMKSKTDSETDSQKRHSDLLRMAEAVADMIDKSDSGYVKQSAAELVERMKAEIDPYSLSLSGWILAGLSGKLDRGDVRPGAAALVERMKAETHSIPLSLLGETLAGLSEKLDSGDLIPGAAALVDRMKTETDSDRLSSLGKALAGLSGKLGSGAVQPGAAALVERMKTETDSDRLSSLGEALAALSKKAASSTSPADSPVSIADYVELLRQPFMVGEARKTLLDGLGKITHQDFHGDLWQFVDWAQTEEGRKLVPSLE